METSEKKYIPDWLKRLFFTLLAMFASWTLMHHPVFSFQEDKGIIYVRSFSMDSQQFYVTQTNISNGASEVVNVMPVMGLYVCAWVMLVMSGLVLLCFWDDVWRMRLAVIAAFCSGAYYFLMIYYAIEITDEFFTTLYPNLFALIPAVVLQLMLVVRRNVARSLARQNDDEEKSEETIEE